MCKLLIISFEANNQDITTAAIQQATLTFVEKRVENPKLIFLKEHSFFIDAYTKEHIFDSNQGILSAEEYSYNKVDAYPDTLKRYTLDEALVLIQKAVNHATIIVAHNGLSYHIPILQRLGIDFSGKVILDTLEHINYSQQVNTRALPYLCASHNFLLYQGEAIPRTESVNKAIMRLLNLYSVEETIKKAVEESRKTIMLLANITYEQKEEAKKLGFKFDKDKKWYQKVSKERYEELLSIMGPVHLAVINN